MTRYLGWVLLPALLLAAPQAVRAQLDAFSGPLSPGNWMSTFNMDPVSQLVEQERRNADAQAEPEPPATSPASASSLRFTATTDRRAANLASFVQKTKAVDPAGAEQLETLFASSDIIALMEQELSKVGLHTDNLADAYALWWINCWSAVHAEFSTPDRATIDAVRGQAARALVTGGKTAEISDALKQQFAEAMLVQALLLDSALQQAKGNPAQLELLATAANAGAKGMGLDMENMILTPEGFVPRT